MSRIQFHYKCSMPINIPLFPGPGYQHALLTPQMSFASDTAELLDTSTPLGTVFSSNSLSPAHKNIIGKLGLRKPSVLSISSAASSQGIFLYLKNRKTILYIHFNQVLLHLTLPKEQLVLCRMKKRGRSLKC